MSRQSLAPNHTHEKHQEHSLHRKGILVVTIADITSRVLLVGTAVDEALGIVDVTIARRAAGCGRVGDVLEVDEDQARGAARVPGLRADSYGVLELLVDDDVVRAADGQLVEVARQVGVAKGHGAGRVDVGELGHVEELHAVLLGLAADHDVALVASDLAPDAGCGC